MYVLEAITFICLFHVELQMQVSSYCGYEAYTRGCKNVCIYILRRCAVNVCVSLRKFNKIFYVPIVITNYYNLKYCSNELVYSVGNHFGIQSEFESFIPGGYIGRSVHI
jgi:hypothetical protein